MGPLIYGKNNTTNIVNIEPHDGYLDIFQEIDNKIIVTHLPNKYWILSHKPLNKSFIKLKGNLHYQYGKQFDSRDDFVTFRSIHKKEDIFSIWNPKESSMVNKGLTYFKGMTPKDVSLLSFDIETTGLDPSNDNAKVLLISTVYRNSKETVKKLFAYDEYKSQADMLDDFCTYVREKDPSLLIGHNIVTFDLYYLDYIANINGTELRLGRNDSAIKIDNRESQFRVDGSRDLNYKRVSCYGREIVDTLFLAYKYDIGRKYESYGLKPIIKTEGLEDPNRTFYDSMQIRYNYTNPVEWEKIKAYCEDDAMDAIKIYDLMVPPFFYMTQAIPKSFQSVIESATGSQINSMMIRSYLQDAHSLPKASEPLQFEGAISDSKPGIYNNVYKVDAKSMYPSIMLQYNITDPVKDPNNNLLKILDIFTQERLKNKELAKTTKEERYVHLEQSAKIFINSIYGFLAAPGLLFNCPPNAAKVTEHGREIITKAIKWAESKNFTVCNVDTDSISFTDNGRDLSKDERKELLKDLNSLYPEKIIFDDDGYFIKVIILKTKNYLLYDGVKKKIKGSALRDPKKQPAVKELYNKFIDFILEDKPKELLSETYKSYAKEIFDIKDIKRWSTRKTISEKVLTSERTNESKVRDAFEGTEYTEGDRIYCYFKQDDTLGLVEHYKNDHNTNRLLKTLFDSVQVFGTILPVKEMFVNYSLKRSKKDLEELLKL